jgi:hypothetical protein
LRHVAHQVEFVEDLPAHFALNVDGMDHQDSADRQGKMSIVPTSHDGTRVCDLVSRVRWIIPEADTGRFPKN